MALPWEMITTKQVLMNFHSFSAEFIHLLTGLKLTLFLLSRVNWLVSWYIMVWPLLLALLKLRVPVVLLYGLLSAQNENNINSLDSLQIIHI